MRRALAAFLGFVVVALFSPANGSAQESQFVALISDTSNQYWKAFEEGLRDTSERLGIPIQIYTLQGATDAEGQLNKCESALLIKPKVILFAAVNGMNLATCLRKAHASGTLLVDVDGNVDEELAARMRVPVAFSVASDNSALGAFAAKYLAEARGKVLVLEGLSGSRPSERRVRGFKENLPQALQIIASQPGEWDRAKAADITARTLLRHPDLAVVFAANDTMALGAVEALRTAGKTGVKVVGIDGSADAVKAIREGRLTASVAQLPYLMAVESVEKARRHLAGEAFEFHQYVPIIALDKQLLEAGTSELLAYLH